MATFFIIFLIITALLWVTAKLNELEEKIKSWKKVDEWLAGTELENQRKLIQAMCKRLHEMEYKLMAEERS